MIRPKMRLVRLGSIGLVGALLSCSGEPFSPEEGETGSSVRVRGQTEPEDGGVLPPGDELAKDDLEQTDPDSPIDDGAAGETSAETDAGANPGGGGSGNAAGGTSSVGGGGPGEGGASTEGGSGGGVVIQPPSKCPGEQLGCVVDWVGNWHETGAVDARGQDARLTEASGITSDDGFLYITDNHAVRRIDLETAEVETIAGRLGMAGDGDGRGESALFDQPKGLATDGTKLWIADSGNDVIRSIDLRTRNVTTLSGRRGSDGFADGSSGDARFDEMQDLAFDGQYLYLVESGNHAVRRIHPENGTVLTVAGGQSQGLSDGTGSSAQFSEPTHIEVGQAQLFIGDAGNNRPRVLTLPSQSSGGQLNVSSPFGSAVGYEDGVGTDARFNRPRGVAYDGRALIVADSENSVLRAIDIGARLVTTIAGQPGKSVHAEGAADRAGFAKPMDVHFDQETQDLFISEGSVLRRMYHK